MSPSGAASLHLAGHSARAQCHTQSNFPRIGQWGDTMTDERRKEERVTVCLDATWLGRSSKNNARAVDLSEGGCYIDTIVEVSEGEALTFGLMMNDGKWLVLKGVVAHRTPRLGFGIRFVDLTDEQRGKIQSILRRAKAEDTPEVLFDIFTRA